MFLSTLWLLAADHSRKWKDYQRKFQEIENWTLVSRDNEQQTENYTLAENALQAAVDRAVLTPPSRTEVDAFIGQTSTFGGVERVESQVASLNSAYAALTAELAGLDLPHEDNAQLHKHAGTIASQRESLFAEMDAVIAAVKFVEDGGATKRKFRRADLDAAKSKYDLAVRDGLSAKEKRKLRDAVALVEVDVADLTIAYEAANEHRKALERIRKELQADETAARKQLAEFRSTRDQLQRHRVRVPFLATADQARKQPAGQRQNNSVRCEDQAQYDGPAHHTHSLHGNRSNRSTGRADNPPSVLALAVPGNARSAPNQSPDDGT